MSASLAIVRASAGSGKTFTLALEYCRAVVVRPEAYREILAVTFTNKATGEMKQRIVEELSRLADSDSGVGKSDFADRIVSDTSFSRAVVADRARRALSLILSDYSSFSVMTIDKFFQRIVRSFFRELGLDFSYSIEIDSGASLRMAVDRLIDESGNDMLLSQLVERLVSQSLDRGRSWNAARELQKISGEILGDDYREPELSPEELILAYAELKKSYDTSVVAIRAEAAAACELIVAVGLSPTDFKYGTGSFAHYLFRISRGAPIEAYGKRMAALLDDPTSAYNEKSESRGAIISILPTLITRVARIIELYDSTLVERSTFDALTLNFAQYLLLGRLKDSFSRVLSDGGKMAISHSTGFIDRIAREASVPFIFEKLGSRYNTIFIDEFQDTSWPQWRGFLPLVEEVLSSAAESGRVMLIGDVKQAIYRWRGGDWDILGYRAAEQFEDALDETQSLTTSYRSEARIVRFNNELIRSVMHVAQGAISEFLTGERGEQFDLLITALARSYGDAEQSVSPHKMLKNSGYVEVQRNEDAEQDLEYMVSVVRDAIERGYKASDIAVLVRSRKEGAAAAHALVDAGFGVVSDEALALVSSVAVNFVIDLIRYSIERDAVSRAAINRYLGRDMSAEFETEQSEFIASITRMTPVEAFEAIVRHFELENVETAYLQALYDRIYRFSVEEKSDVAAFLAYWDEKGAKFSLALSACDTSVNVLTIHKAKGLEYEVVIIPFASWSTVPSTNPPTRIWGQSAMAPYARFNPFPLTYSDILKESIYREDYLHEGVHSMIDNLNLLYVALTRAKSELYVAVPQKTKKNTIGKLIETALESMPDFEGHAGFKQIVEAPFDQTDEKMLVIERLACYDERTKLDLSEDQDEDPLFGEP